MYTKIEAAPPQQEPSSVLYHINNFDELVDFFRQNGTDFELRQAIHMRNRLIVDLKDLLEKGNYAARLKRQVKEFSEKQAAISTQPILEELDKIIEYLQKLGDETAAKKYENLKTDLAADLQKLLKKPLVFQFKPEKPLEIA
jgi:hypothetical protein